MKKEKNEISRKMPLSKTLGVLIGFPIIATLISLLLFNQNIITDQGLDFYTTFWIIISLWYLIQIFLIFKILQSEGWSWGDIGYSLNTKRTLFFCLGYLLFAFSLLFFIEYTLANTVVNSEKFDALLSLSPKNTLARVIFIIMGLVAGLAEEFVYRGFAMKALISNHLNRWLAVVLAAVPFVFQHGIKAYQLTWSSWYLIWGIVFGILFLLSKKLYLTIVIHWLIILSAMVAILQAVG